MSNQREFAINTPTHIVISNRAADRRQRMLRLWLMAFVLLGLTMLAMSAHACNIEHTDSNTITIRGECGEAVLMSQLSIAIARLEARGELTRDGNSSSDSDKSKRIGRLDLVNGTGTGGRSTFFHRRSSKK